MRDLSELDLFHLHDGTLSKIDYDKKDHKLTFHLELAETSPAIIGINGYMIFYNVKNMDIPYQYIDKEIDGEIINVKYSTEISQENYHEIGWLIYIYKEPKTCKDVLSIQFLAKNFSWIKLP